MGKGATPTALERLEKAEDWTEAPTRQAAESLADDPQAAEDVKPAEQGGKKPATARKSPAKVQPKAPPKVERPWEAALQMHDGTSAATRLANFKLPGEMYAKLRWLADTTFDYSMTRIVIEALEVKIEQMLKERAK
ncbi:MAG TPA: hypothetical protein VF389_07820 [Woeseiaceae bacterium]